MIYNSLSQSARNLTLSDSQGLQLKEVKKINFKMGGHVHMIYAEEYFKA